MSVGDGLNHCDNGAQCRGWICSWVQNPPEVPPCARGDAIFIFGGAAAPYFDYVFAFLVRCKSGDRVRAGLTALNLFQRIDASLGDLVVLLAGDPRHTNGANNLSIEHHW